MTTNSISSGREQFSKVGSCCPSAVRAFLRLKSRKGRLSPAQKQFSEAALAAGALYEVARTTDEEIAVLSTWKAVRISGKGRAA